MSTSTTSTAADDPLSFTEAGRHARFLLCLGLIILSDAVFVGCWFFINLAAHYALSWGSTADPNLGALFVGVEWLFSIASLLFCGTWLVKHTWNSSKKAWHTR